MDKDILVQYSDMVEEVKDLRLRIRKIQDEIDKLDQVSDSVKGTRKDGTIGPIRISGYPIPRYEKLKRLLHTRQAILRDKEEELLELMNRAEEYIAGISDSRIRRIMRYRYIDGLSWIQTAHRMGGNHTADGCRNAHDRYLGLKK